MDVISSGIEDFEVCAGHFNLECAFGGLIDLRSNSH